MYFSKICNSDKSCWMRGLGFIVAIGMLFGCASMSMDAHPKADWSCDEQADAAVEQENWQQAIERHNQLLSVDPGNCLAMYHLGFIWGKLEDRQLEVGWYEKAVACGYAHNDELFFNLGMAYADLDQKEKAIAALNHATKVNPDNAENFFGLGLTSHTMGDTALAERSLAQAVAISPNHWDAHLLLAKIFLDQGRMQAARIHIEGVLRHAPENEAAVDLWRLYQDRVSAAFEN